MKLLSVVQSSLTFNLKNFNTKYVYSEIDIDIQIHRKNYFRRERNVIDL